MHAQLHVIEYSGQQFKVCCTKRCMMAYAHWCYTLQAYLEAYGRSELKHWIKLIREHDTSMAR